MQSIILQTVPENLAPCEIFTLYARLCKELISMQFIVLLSQNAFAVAIPILIPVKEPGLYHKQLILYCLSLD